MERVTFELNSEDRGPEYGAEMALAKQMQEIACKEFPGYGWVCGADLRKTAGIVTMRLPPLMAEGIVYVEHAEKLNNYNDLVAFVKKSGGEILERFRLPRAKLTIESFDDARARYQPVTRLHMMPN